MNVLYKNKRLKSKESRSVECPICWYNV